MLLLTAMRTLFGWCVLVLAVLVPQLNSQSSPPVTVQWPDADKPILKLVFAGFSRVGLVNGEGIYSSDVTAQNLADQSMPRSVFTVNILDANGVKIGRASRLSQSLHYHCETGNLFILSGVEGSLLT